MIDVARPTSSTTIIVIWVFRVLVAAMFLFAAYMKLSSNPMMVAEFEKIGFGDGFRYLTGIIELVGAIALVVPTVSVFGAILLLCVDIGAFVTQIAILHGDWIHTIVLGLILAALVYTQRDRLSFERR